jgi:cytidine deaminase
MSSHDFISGSSNPESMLGLSEKPSKTTDEAVDEYVRSVARRPTLTETNLVRQAYIELERAYEYKRRQLYCVALTERGTDIGAPQADFGNGSNICAEMAVFFRNSDPVQRLMTIVVAHKNNPEGQNPGHVHLAVPCGSCRERLLEHHPDIEVIISYKGEIIVMRMDALLPLVFKRRNGNGQVHTQ